MTHALVVDDLRPFKAHCSCGQWSMTYLNHADESEGEVRAKAERQFDRHATYTSQADVSRSRYFLK